MARIRIYEYPGELLWHSREHNWYLDNDPSGINLALTEKLYVVKQLFPNEIDDYSAFLDEAYRLTVAVGCTYRIKFSNAFGVLRTNYNTYSSLLGCAILQNYNNASEFADIIDKLMTNAKNVLEGDRFMQLYYYNHSFESKMQDIIKSVRTKGAIDRILPQPEAPEKLYGFTIDWLENHIRTDEDAEDTIRLYQTADGQRKMYELLRRLLKDNQDCKINWDKMSGIISPQTKSSLFGIKFGQAKTMDSEKEEMKKKIKELQLQLDEANKRISEMDELRKWLTREVAKAKNETNRVKKESEKIKESEQDKDIEIERLKDEIERLKGVVLDALAGNETTLNDKIDATHRGGTINIFVKDSNPIVNNNATFNAEVNNR